jgi:signal peptidase I
MDASAHPHRAGTGPSRIAHQVVTASLTLAVTTAALAASLLVFGPHVFPYRIYAIESGSMRPTLPVGSLAVLRPVQASRISVGDIITFEKPGAASLLVTHRVVAIKRERGARFFVTKGDANGTPDAWRVPTAGTGWRYAFSLPYAGYPIAALKQPVLRFGFFATLALALAAGALLRVWRAPAAG